MSISNNSSPGNSINDLLLQLFEDIVKNSKCLSSLNVICGCFLRRFGFLLTGAPNENIVRNHLT